MDSQARNEHQLIIVSSFSLLQGPEVSSAARAAGTDAWERAECDYEHGFQSQAQFEAQICYLLTV